LESLANEFLLDPEIIYLNHGSFGATPRPVFETYQNFQRELERQPVEFLGREFQARMASAREALARYLGTASKDIVFVTNATTGLNIIARSLSLGSGDDVLASDHEYGAMDRTWRFLAQKNGFNYVRNPIHVPVQSSKQLVEQIWRGVTKNTRVIFISHITSPTSIIFPIQKICVEARKKGILTVIDGAHAPGQIPLNLHELGADFYVGNLHKWLCAPKGSGFLYAHQERQALLSPLIVSWGWESEKPSSSTFIDYHEWQGTRDPAAFLAVPEAIHFQEIYRWDDVRRTCHELAYFAQITLSELTGIPPLSSPELFAQMVSVILPDVDVESFQKRLLDEFHIEIPVFKWNKRTIMRVSVQGYNARSDIDQLINAIHQIMTL
jgi:isopenicillin-N epimerase